MAMLDGTARYPDDFSRSLSTAHTLVTAKDESARRKGFDLAIQAFELIPSQCAAFGNPVCGKTP